MRSWALALALAATAIPAGWALSAAGVQRLVASPGWQLEFFGQDVAILRTALRGAANGEAGQVLMSCEGPVRRMRITLPGAASGRSATDITGTAMIKPPGESGPGMVPAIGRFLLQRDRILTFDEQDGSGGDATLQLARLLAGLPARLELLIHYGHAPITIRRVLPYMVSLTFDRGDAIAFASFISNCARKSG